jgi:hypothetical protein
MRHGGHETFAPFFPVHVLPTTPSPSSHEKVVAPRIFPSVAASVHHHQSNNDANVAVLHQEQKGTTLEKSCRPRVRLQLRHQRDRLLANRQHRTMLRVLEHICSSTTKQKAARTSGRWMRMKRKRPVFHAMQRLGDQAGVQESGCTALSNLSCSVDNKVTIAANGGIEAIVNAMHRHGAHAGVKKHGDLALKNLGGRNRKNRALSADAQIAALPRSRDDTVLDCV